MRTMLHVLLVVLIVPLGYVTGTLCENFIVGFRAGRFATIRMHHQFLRSRKK